MIAATWLFQLTWQNVQEAQIIKALQFAALSAQFEEGGCSSFAQHRQGGDIYCRYNVHISAMCYSNVIQLVWGIYCQPSLLHSLLNVTATRSFGDSESAKWITIKRRPESRLGESMLLHIFGYIYAWLIFTSVCSWVAKIEWVEYQHGRKWACRYQKKSQ